MEANTMEGAMSWFDTIAIYPILLQAESSLNSWQPTNPSSLTLALLGAGIYLLFSRQRIFERRVLRDPRTTSGQQSEPRKAA